MPTQHRAAEAAGFAKGQNAFKLCRLGRACKGGIGRLVAIILFLFVGHNAIEERGRWQLLVIADDDDLLDARDETERVFRPNLTGFVDDEQVKHDRSRRQELRHGDRAHQQNRLDPLQCLARSLEQLADRHVTAPTPDLGADRIHRAIVPSGNIRGVAATHDVNGRTAAVGLERSEFFCYRVVLRPIKFLQRGYGGDGILPNCFGVGAVEYGFCFVGHDRTGRQGVGQRRCGESPQSRIGCREPPPLRRIALARRARGALLRQGFARESGRAQRHGRPWKRQP